MPLGEHINCKVSQSSSVDCFDLEGNRLEDLDVDQSLGILPPQTSRKLDSSLNFSRYATSCQPHHLRAKHTFYDTFYEPPNRSHRPDPTTSSKTPRCQRLRLAPRAQQRPLRRAQRRGGELAPVAAGGSRVVALHGAHQLLEAIFEEGHGSEWLQGISGDIATVLILHSYMH